MVPEIIRRRSNQLGATAVEFVLVASLLLTLLFGIMEMGRIFFYLNTAGEATRLGARLAVVCNANAATIKTKMVEMLPLLTATRINVSYEPDGCSSSVLNAQSTCHSVTVSIAAGLNIDTYIPFIPFSI